MMLKLNNKYVKFYFITITLLITLTFVVMSQFTYKKNKINQNLSEFKSETKNIHTILTQKFTNHYKKENFQIQKGQSLNTLLSNSGISDKEIFNLTKLLSTFINLKKINTNQIFQVLVNKKTGELKRLTVNINNITSLHIFKKENKLVANKIEKVLYKKTSLSEGIIKSSLFRAAQKDNIEPEVIIEFARVFGFEIDFQRDIRKNDIFQIVYEKYVDDDGEVQKSGDIIYAYMNNK